MDRLGYDGVGFNEHHTLALRADELAQPDGRGGGAAHQEAQAADLRQPAAAARAAAAGRGAGDDRLPVERPADLRLRARHPARIPGAQRAAGRSRARASRRPTRSSPAPGPRTCSPTRASSGRYKDVAIWPRPGAAAASADLDRRSSAARNRSSSPARHNIPITPGAGAAAGCATTSSATTPSAWPRPAIASRPTTCRSASTPMSPIQQGAGGEGGGTLSPLLQPHAVQPRQLHRDRAAAPGRLRQRRTRPTTCGRRTSAPPRCCARISAT